jgi:hypothetical protein
MPIGFFSLKHRQMAHALLRHDRHTLINGLFWLHDDDLSFHDVPHGRFGRRFALENNIARIVPFGDDANDLVAFHHYPDPMSFSAIFATASKTVASG